MRGWQRQIGHLSFCAFFALGIRKKVILVREKQLTKNVTIADLSHKYIKVPCYIIRSGVDKIMIYYPLRPD